MMATLDWNYWGSLLAFIVAWSVVLAWVIFLIRK
jgi:hypothetical protein